MSGIKGERKVASACVEDAAAMFVQRTCGDWSAEDQATLNERLATDADFAQAFAGVAGSWQSAAAHAETPEILEIRESAIAWLRRENVQRWQGKSRRPYRARVAIAAAIVVAVACVGALLSPDIFNPNAYSTGIDQQRQLILADRSLAKLDAATRMRVEYSNTARRIRLLEGQAQFSVAKDAARPFIVQVGDRSIVALGTVFTVEYVDQKVHVATMEGKVAVLPAQSSAAAVPVGAGEELRIDSDGKAVVTSKADLAAATAWLQGSVIFRDEPLGEAARRMNRYSHLHVRITDPALAALRISGVFQSGDTVGFARSVEGYYPVAEARTDSRTLSLQLK